MDELRIVDMGASAASSVPDIRARPERVAIRSNHARLVVVSNRLPLTISRDDETGDTAIVSASGGLVTALGPVLSRRGGLWIGWSGTSGARHVTGALQQASHALGYDVVPVDLTAEEIRCYYEGFANEVLWPLFHDLVGRANFDLTYWPSYQRANIKFAKVVAACTSSEDQVWIHDYHLLLVARELRALGIQRRASFFLHIPFPAPDVLHKLPQHKTLVDALLEYNLLGFQTPTDVRNFVEAARAQYPTASLDASSGVLCVASRIVRVGAFPIGIDFQQFEAVACGAEVECKIAQLRQRLGARKLLLGLDRLDYSKGIPARLRAFELALERRAELREQVTFLQVIVPSRERIRAYQELKDEIERIIGAINGRFSSLGWTPVQYIYRSLDAIELSAFYRLSDVACVTPLKDGMNLVAKEYCACNVDETGVLVLSEFAGAACQLHDHALLVNPFDVEAMAEAFTRGVTMDRMERRRHMRALRANIRVNDVHDWVDGFLTRTLRSQDDSTLSIVSELAPVAYSS